MEEGREGRTEREGDREGRREREKEGVRKEGGREEGKDEEKKIKGEEAKGGIMGESVVWSVNPSFPPLEPYLL